MENNDLLGRESISEFRNGSLFENQGLGVSKLSCHAEKRKYGFKENDIS